VLCHPVFFLPSVFEIITTHKVKKNMAKEASGTGAIIRDGTGGMGRHLSWFCQKLCKFTCRKICQIFISKPSTISDLTNHIIIPDSVFMERRHQQNVFRLPCPSRSLRSQNSFLRPCRKPSCSQSITKFAHVTYPW